MDVKVVLRNAFRNKKSRLNRQTAGQNVILILSLKKRAMEYFSSEKGSPINLF